MLAAVKLGVPAALAAAPGGALPYHDLCAAVGIRHGPAFRGSLDFLDLLVALGVLAREGGPGPGAAYRCASPQVAEQLGGSDGSAAPGLVFMNDRLYRFWGGLEASLRTGEAQSEARAAAPGGSLFDALRGGGEADVEAFAQAMTALNLPHIRALAASAFDFSGRAALADIGGSAGALCAVLARAHPHLLCTTYDRAELAPVAGRYLEREGLAGQVQVQVLCWPGGGWRGGEVQAGTCSCLKSISWGGQYTLPGVLGLRPCRSSLRLCRRHPSRGARSAWSTFGRRRSCPAPTSSP